MKRRELVKMFNRVYASGLTTEHADSLIVNVIRPKMDLEGEIISISVMGFDESTNAFKCFDIMKVGETIDDSTLLDRLNVILSGYSWYDTLVVYDDKLNAYLGRNKEIMYSASDFIRKLNSIKYNYRLNGPALKLADAFISHLKSFIGDYVVSIDIIVVPNGKDKGAGVVIPFKEATKPLPDDKELAIQLTSWYPPTLAKLEIQDVNIYPNFVCDMDIDELIEFDIHK